MPLFWLSLAFVTGLVLADGLPWSAAVWAGLAAGCLAAVFAERRLAPRLPWYPDWRRLARLPLALVLGALCLGGLRAVSARPVWTQANLPWYHQLGVFRLIGVVQTPPEVRLETVTLLVAVDQLTPLVDGAPVDEPRAVHGLVRVSLRGGTPWRYGDRVELVGTPAAPQGPDGSGYPDYLNRQGIASVLDFPTARLLEREQGSPLWAWIFDLRQRAERTLRQLLPQPEAALLAGVLLGSDQDLPERVAQAFRTTGIAHIIAVSGFNVAIVSSLFVTYLGRLLRARYAAPLAILGIGGYALLTGGSPSVVRAAIMGGVGVLGPLLGRRQVGVNSLAFTAGVMCLLSPQMPWDISFQLSFAATLGLVLYAEPMQQAFTGWLAHHLARPTALRISGWVAEFLLFTLAAQLFTLPVTAVHFQRVSLSALLVNPLVLPLQPLIMLLGGLALIVGLAFAPLGQLLAALCWPLLAYTIRAAELFATLPYSQLNLGRLNAGLVLLYYAGLIGLILPPVRQRLSPFWRPAAAILLSGLLALGLWRTAAAAPDGRLRLELLNLPGGSALLLRSPDGQTWLLNQSTRPDALADALGRRQSPLDNRLDGVLVTERSAAPLQVLAQLGETYRVNWLAQSAHLPETSAFKRAAAALKDQGARPLKLEPGLRVTLGGGATLLVLADLEAGTALLVEWQGFRALLPGGLAPPDLPQPLPVGLTLVVLTPSDLKTLSAADWANLFQTQGVVLTAGSAANTLSLEQYQWLALQTDGAHLWLEGQKK